MLSIEAPYGDEHSPFHTLMSADIRGPLDVALLKAAIAHTTQRHEGLLERPVLPSWEPLVIEQSLPQLVAGADPVEVVYAMWAARRFSDRNPAVISRCFRAIQVLVQDFLRGPVTKSRVETCPILAELNPSRNVLLRLFRVI
jgi:hypothetical protein